jgi:hypothetical protein
MKTAFINKAIFSLFTVGVLSSSGNDGVLLVQAFPKKTTAPTSAPTPRICTTTQPDWCATTTGPTCGAQNGVICECLPAKIAGAPSVCFDPKNGFAANGCPIGAPCNMDSDCTTPGDLCMLANAGSNPMCQCPMGICVPTCPVTM